MINVFLPNHHPINSIQKQSNDDISYEDYICMHLRTVNRDLNPSVIQLTENIEERNTILSNALSKSKFPNITEPLIVVFYGTDVGTITEVRELLVQITDYKKPAFLFALTYNSLHPKKGYYVYHVQVRDLHNVKFEFINSSLHYHVLPF